MLRYHSNSPPRYIYPKELQTGAEQIVPVDVHSSSTHNSQKTVETTQKSADWRVDTQNVLYP